MSSVSQAESETDPSAATESVPAAPNRVVVLVSKGLGKSRDWLMSRQPRPFPTVVMLVGTCVLLGLGGWQIQRTHEKNSLLDEITREFAAPPLNFALNLQTKPPKTAEEWRKLHYKPVILQGNWMTPVYMLRLGPRVHEEKQGYHLIMPLRLDNNQVVLVNRGFMPEKMASLPPVPGPVLIHGVAYQPDPVKPPYLPENIPSRDVWTWTDLPAMAHEVGVREVAPVIIYEDRVSDRDSYPIGGQLPLPSHNRHWHYAVTWYALALTLMVIWMTSSNPKQPQSDATPPADGQKDLSDPVARRGMYPEATD